MRKVCLLIMKKNCSVLMHYQLYSQVNKIQFANYIVILLTQVILLGTINNDTKENDKTPTKGTKTIVLLVKTICSTFVAAGIYL